MIPKLILIVTAAMVIAMPAPVLAQSPRPAPSGPELTTGSIPRTSPLSGPPTALTVSSLKGMELVATTGKAIGVIEGIVVSKTDGRQFALVERGGFLGFGAEKFAIALENATVTGDKITVANVKAAPLAGMVDYDEGNPAFRKLDDIQPVILRQG